MCGPADRVVRAETGDRDGLGGVFYLESPFWAGDGAHVGGAVERVRRTLYDLNVGVVQHLQLHLLFPLLMVFQVDGLGGQVDMLQGV